MERKGRFSPTVTICILLLALARLATAQYGGGAGEPNDPYQIYTPEQMNAIGADPNDWDKHFKLMADIDLSAYAGDEFNLIGSDRRPSRGTRGMRMEVLGETTPASFTGVFNGNGHTISNFSYTCGGKSYIGLFRQIDDPNAMIKSLALMNPDIDAGTGSQVGSLVGCLGFGTVTDCYVKGGIISGRENVGGLVGCSGSHWRNNNSLITKCYATGVVTGSDSVGGLVGYGRMITGCYADTVVRGHDHVGGLAGNVETVANCYAEGIVTGNKYVGGLAGQAGSVTNCYATPFVRGESDVDDPWGRLYTGGLVGDEQFPYRNYDHVVSSFWDTKTSRQATSAGGVGKTTAEMQTIFTFRIWGQDGNESVWTIDEGNDYPRLAWENRPGVVIEPTPFSDFLAGAGTKDDPFLIYAARQLDLIGQFPGEWDKHYKLMADIDLSSYTDAEFHLIGSPEEPFQGIFDGNGHTISNFTYVSRDRDHIGLFAYVQLDPCIGRRYCDPNDSAVIMDLGLVDSDLNGGAGNDIGALVGYLASGTVTNCYVEGGVVSTPEHTQGPAGGLVGSCGDLTNITACYSSAVVIGGTSVGGLVGHAYYNATIKNCYATGTVIGDLFVGGLVGYGGAITNCYATGFVLGRDSGGLAGVSTGRVGPVASFWDVEASGQDTSAGGMGLTTAEMMTAAPFLEAGWDFVGEDENGVEEVWWILEGRDYPRLWWEAAGVEF